MRDMQSRLAKLEARQRPPIVIESKDRRDARVAAAGAWVGPLPNEPNRRAAIEAAMRANT
jgi:hypothetical protein